MGKTAGGQFARRLLDVVVGTVLALATLPLVVILAAGSAAVLGTWPFFAQIRIGRHQRPIRIYKIRTLPREAPAEADKYHIAATVPIPRLCRALRRLHLDELPQLWLVPVGRLSLVGPRPEMLTLHRTFDPDFAALRTSVRPGCSGLWQISDRAAHLIREAPEDDRLYVAHASLRLDLWILWRTARAVAGSRRPVTLDEIPGWALVGADATTTVDSADELALG